MYRIDRGHVAGAHHVRSYAHEKLARSPCKRDRLDRKSDISFSLKFLSSSSEIDLRSIRS